MDKVGDDEARAGGCRNRPRRSLEAFTGYSRGHRCGKRRKRTVLKVQRAVSCSREEGYRAEVASRGGSACTIA
jgi:hypothetical protein